MKAVFPTFASLSIGLIIAAAPVDGAYRDAVGWNRLVEELGDDLPAGRDIKVSLIESPASPFIGNYKPDVNNFDFAGKNFTIVSPDAGVSNHATVVAQRFFGNSTSMSGEIDAIDVYESVDWLLEGFLRVNREPFPAVETSRIQNHSWAGAFDEIEYNIEAVRRLDYAIGRDGFLAVVALRNDTGQVPALMAHAYNVITVGRMDGSHSRDGTWFEGAGRNRPDLVAPGGLFTSYSAPVVSSAAALLLEEADHTPALANARHDPRVIRAILMAGASKDPFPEWSRAADRPLDEVFGAGRLAVDGSYRILTGGEHGPEGGGTLPASGWSAGEVASNQTATYAISLERAQGTFTAHLAWNRVVGIPNDLNFADVDIWMPRFELRLFKATDGMPGEEVQSSVDMVNNNQHLFLRDLPAGEYLLRIERTDGLALLEAGYALAWDAVPASPATFADWQNALFAADVRDDPKISGPLADPDGDGVKNLMEYALGLDPWTASRVGLPEVEVIEIEGELYLALRFIRRPELEDIEYRVVAGDDWVSPAMAAEKVRASPAEGGGEEVIYRHPRPHRTAARGFLQLEVTVREPK